MKDIIKLFKSIYKPIKLDNVKPSELDLRLVRIPHLGKVS